MTLVLVNGNPETAAIWDPLVGQLGRHDVVRLSPPGFGAAIPEGFRCSVMGYRDWLIGELERMDSPVDLVGHDVGGSTVVLTAMARPDLIRTWTSDSLGVFDPDYAWHDLARGWQTPEVGEKSVKEMMGGSLPTRVQRMVGNGIPKAVAEQIAPAQGARMGQAILEFYRSAIQPVMATLGHDLPHAAARPGLAVIGTADAFVGSEQLRRRSAARAGARPVVLPDVGHWWMVQDPPHAAAMLTSFWDEQA